MSIPHCRNSHLLTLREEKLLHIFVAKSGSTAWTFAVPRIKVPLDAWLAEHVHALGDDDILLPLMTHIAAQQAPQSLQFLLCLARHATLAFPLLSFLQSTLHCLSHTHLFEACK